MAAPRHQLARTDRGHKPDHDFHGDMGALPTPLSTRTQGCICADACSFASCCSLVLREHDDAIWVQNKLERSSRPLPTTDTPSVPNDHVQSASNSPCSTLVATPGVKVDEWDHSSPVGSPEDSEGMRELLSKFVSRGTQGVSCQIVDAMGAWSHGSYRLDRALESLTFFGEDWECIKFSQVIDIFQVPHCPEQVLACVDNEQRNRLIHLTYSTDIGTQHVSFLESSAQDCRNFTKCVPIICSYMSQKQPAFPPKVRPRRVSFDLNKTSYVSPARPLQGRSALGGA